MSNQTLVQHANAHGTGPGSPPGSVILGSSPGVGNLILAFLSMGPGVNTTIDTTKWTVLRQADVTDHYIWCLYRYVQIGDTTTLPAFSSSGAGYWVGLAYEISGVTGTIGTDVPQSEGAETTGSDPFSITTMTTTNTNQIAIVAASCYSGSGGSLPAFSVGWTADEQNTDFGDYGIWGSGHQNFPSSGASVNCSVALSSATVAYIALLLQGDTGPTAYTLTSAKGTFSLTGEAAGLTFTRRVSATRGVYHLLGEAVSGGFSRTLKANHGTYRIRKQKVLLSKNGNSALIWSVDTGDYNLIGEAVVFGHEDFRMTFSEFINTDYKDWTTISGADFDSYLNTMFIPDQDFMTFSQTPYLYVFIEDGTDMGLFLDVARDWATTGNVPKLGQPLQVYRYRNGFLLSVTKSRFRGKGRVYQLQFTSDGDKDFNLRGWAVWTDKNPGP